MPKVKVGRHHAGGSHRLGSRAEEPRRQRARGNGSHARRAEAPQCQHHRVRQVLRVLCLGPKACRLPEREELDR